MSFNIINYNFEHIYSTNTWAIQNFHLLDRNAITIVTTNEQSMGRGRHNRQWHSPPNMNLYSTYCFFMEETNTSLLANLPQIIALSCISVLKSLGLTPQIKWPNNIMIGNKKISGILCETKNAGPQRFYALGIGLNINMPIDNLSQISKPATSILLETGREYSIGSLKTLLTEKFLEDFEIFLDQGFDPFYNDFKNALYQSDEIQFHNGNSIVKGQFVSINPDGSLSMLVDNKHLQTFYCGEIL